MIMLGMQILTTIVPPPPRPRWARGKFRPKMVSPKALGFFMQNSKGSTRGVGGCCFFSDPSVATLGWLGYAAHRAQGGVSALTGCTWATWGRGPSPMSPRRCQIRKHAARWVSQHVLLPVRKSAPPWADGYVWRPVSQLAEIHVD